MNVCSFEFMIINTCLDNKSQQKLSVQSTILFCSVSFKPILQLSCKHKLKANPEIGGRNRESCRNKWCAHLPVEKHLEIFTLELNT